MKKELYQFYVHLYDRETSYHHLELAWIEWTSEKERDEKLNRFKEEIITTNRGALINRVEVNYHKVPTI